MLSRHAGSFRSRDRALRRSAGPGAAEHHDRAVLFGAVLTLLMVLPAGAQEDADCLYCHEDRDLVVERDGRELSGHVDAATLSDSVHGFLACVDCHADLIDTELPHDWDTERVDCATCHDDAAAAHATSRHAGPGEAGGATCADCHGSHDVESPGSWAGRDVVATCVRCHRAGGELARPDPSAPSEPDLSAGLLDALHAPGLLERGLTVTAVCTSCHDAHEIPPASDPASALHPGRIAATCGACHTGLPAIHADVIPTAAWSGAPGEALSCVLCHEPHPDLPRPEAARTGRASCLACHDATAGGTAAPVDGHELGRSVHARLACASCHTDVSAPAGGERPCITSSGRVDCGTCHAASADGYRAGVHGTLARGGDAEVPTCIDCHGTHDIRSRDDPAAPTFSRNVPGLCGTCHAEGGRAAARIEGEGAEAVGHYLASIHGRGLVEAGLTVTATCVSCHGAHEIRTADDPLSRVSPDRIADTCGSCHVGIEATFRASIHGAEGPDAPEGLPSCRDCHDAHTVARTDEEAFRARTMDQCGRCHEAQSATYYETFHGKVSRLGADRAAKCHDCHGAHDILPPDHPDSMLAADHKVATCAACHDGAHRRFTTYLPHATHDDPERWPWLYWTYVAMTSLLVGTMVVALAHTLLFFVRLLLDRADWLAHRRAVRAGLGDARLYRRFDRYERMMHLLMVISFLTLALTGMMLKFSDAAWAGALSRLMGGFDTTGMMHRLAGLLLVSVFVWHLGAMVRRKRSSGRTWRQMIAAPESIVFNGRDLPELGATLRWFVGRGPRPRYGRFTYWEKFDYFAVFWGVAVIGLTGFVLWFPVTATRVLPGWALNVATIIHSDEALLAVAFIFTVHFFNANLRPDKFPMDPVIFTGRMPVAELEYERPLEHEHLVATGELERRIVEPMPPAAERAFRIFGGLALSVGVTLIALILYALLQS